MAYTFMLMGQNMKAIGEMTYKMVRELKLGLTVLDMMENIRKARNMDLVNIYGAMEQVMKEIGMIIKYAEMALTLGLMEEYNLNNKIEICWIMAQ